ncbi:MAG: DUF1643 domain-containing protein [bacterium]
MSEGRKESVLDLFLKDKLIGKPEFSEPIYGAGAEGFGIYNDDKSHRYYLYIDLKNDNTKNILTAIMLNPSEKAFDGAFDATVTAVIEIARKSHINKELAKFSAVEIINLFSYKEPNAKKAEEYWQNNKINVNFIKKFLSEENRFNNPILIAWGNKGCKVGKENFIDIITAINNYSGNLYAYYINGTKKNELKEYRLKPILEKQPTHPSPRNKQQLNKFFENPELILITKEPKDT